MHRQLRMAWLRCALALAALVVSAMVLAAPALAVGPASTITLQLSQRTITANGSSSTTAKATVTDGTDPVPGETVTIGSNDAVDSVTPTGGAVTDSNGEYIVTITSTHAGTSTITASDTSTTGITPATKSLTKDPGPPNHVTVQLSPQSIIADGSSTSAVTGTVTDAFGNVVPNQAVTFTPTGRIPSVFTGSNGAYTATYTSTTTPGSVTVKATAGPASGQAPLTQTAFASTTGLSAAPSTLVTNQVTTLIAIVTAAGGGPPRGTVTFQDNGTAIPGCVNQPVAAAAPLVSQSTCQAVLGASSTPRRLTAVFTSTAANVAGSSGATNVTVGKSSTTTSLDVSSPSLGVGSNATYTASITPTHTGPIGLGGSVTFLDGGQAIPACQAQTLSAAFGRWLATCTVHYSGPGTHSVTAHYGGDANFSGSASPPQTVTVHKLPPQVLGTIKATMQWTFFFTPSYTAVRQFVVDSAPVGTALSVSCRGKGCPRANIVRFIRACQPKKGQKCHAARAGVMNLLPALKHRRLKPGTQIVVKITRPHWVGKYYRFAIRSSHAPAILIDCLAPGGSRPGVGC